MRLEGGIKVGYELTMRSCGFKHQSFIMSFYIIRRESNNDPDTR